MQIIDFRCRPNTAEYMQMFADPANQRTWRRFGYPKPPAVELEDFVGELDRQSVAVAVFTGRQRIVDGELVRGITNDYVAECARRHRDRIVGFAGVDPTGGQAAVAELDRAVTELGLRGASIDPDAGRTMPDDRALYPLYEKATELRVPVVITMGPLVGRYADPRAVDVVAEDFPALNIVCSHGCWPQVTELIALPYRRDNVYLEASIYEFLPGAEAFVRAADGLIRERVLYASAFPFNPVGIRWRFEQLPLSDESKRAIMYGNAASLLGLG